MLSWVRHIILGIIDFFHQPFRKWIGVQNFRYLACGGSNTLLDITLYFVGYHFILKERPVHLHALTITPHIAAFIISFSISFPMGFILSKYIVFPHSNLEGRIQLFRYALLVLMCIFLNYIFLKIFVEWCGWFPTPSKILTTAIVAVFSFISQRNFTFKVKEAVVPDYIDQPTRG